MTAEAAPAAEIRTAAVDRDAITSYLTTLFGGADTGWISICAFAPEVGGKKIVSWFDISETDGLAQAVECIASQATHANVFVAVNLQKQRLSGRQRGGASTVAAVTSLVYDLDIGGEGHPVTRADALVFVRSWPLQPSFIVDSGRGLHLYWLLHEPYSIGCDDERIELTDLSRRWGELGHRLAEQHGYKFDSVSDLARVLRPAGSLHLKDPRNPRPVRILNESGNRYALADFEDLMPDDLPADAEAPPAPEEGKSELSEALLTKLATLLLPAWADGSRHCTALLVAGWLANNAVAEASALELARRLSAEAGDRDPTDRQKATSDTYGKLRNGKRPRGWVGLKERLAQSGATPAQISELDHALQPTITYKGRPAPGSADKNEHADSDGAPPNGTGESEESTAKSSAASQTLTDVGNGERFALQHGANVRHSFRLDKWFAWDEKRYRPDDGAATQRLAKKTAKSIYGEAEKARDADSKAIAKHAMQSESAPRIEAMLKMARSESGIPVETEELDRDPWLFNVQNGTINLRAGEFRAHQREDLITKLAPIVYDPAATCPTWEAFLQRSMAGREGKIQFLQRAIGYSLTGTTTERAIFILHGVGKNGKSTLVEVVLALLGEYAMSTPTETLLARRDGGGIPNDVARLNGVRFVSARETEEGERLAEAKIKALTGGDTVSARFMRSEFFDFIPSFKIWLSTNHKPLVRGTDEAIWDRIHLVPFLVRIPAAERDLQLKQKLIAEAPGILNWAITGCLDWQRDGLGDPDEIREATAGYRAEMDVLGGFLADRCILGELFAVTAKELYSAYTTWGEENGERPMSQTAMGKRLTERGFQPFRNGPKRERSWSGIRLRTENDHQSDQNGRVYEDRTRSDATSHMNDNCNFHEGLSQKTCPNVSLDENASMVDGEVVF